MHPRLGVISHPSFALVLSLVNLLGNVRCNADDAIAPFWKQRLKLWERALEPPCGRNHDTHLRVLFEPGLQQRCSAHQWGGIARRIWMQHSIKVEEQDKFRFHGCAIRDRASMSGIKLAVRAHEASLRGCSNSRETHFSGLTGP